MRFVKSLMKRQFYNTVWDILPMGESSEESVA